VAPATASLQWHGFAELRPAALDRPQVPNLARVSDAPPWSTTVEGWYTRYGDIAALVSSSDERPAILNSGDGATLDFPAASLPQLAPGTVRTLLLYNRGWIKEEDPNSLSDRYVEPFPGSNRPAGNHQQDWQLEFNTRWVPRNCFPLLPDRP